MKELKLLFDEIGEYKQQSNKFSIELYPIIFSFCEFCQRNINLFQFGLAGGDSNCSYVDIMKIAIRRQIEVTQKITILLMNCNSVNDISNLWNIKLTKKKFELIYKLWEKEFNFSCSHVQKIKENASDYLHPRLSVKIEATKNINDLSNRIYDDCGGKQNCIDRYILNFKLTDIEKDELKKFISNLFEQDCNNMFEFCGLFIKIVYRLTQKDQISLKPQY